jgi:coatomer protein complex subunit gamma
MNQEKESRFYYKGTTCFHDRCFGDSDDEVRDRAVFYLRLIHNQELSRKYIANESSFSWNVFENMLQNYLENPQGFDTPFDMSIVPIVSKTQEQMESIRQKEVAIELATGVSAIVPQTTHSITKDTGPIQFANIMSEIPQLNQLGPLFKSSPVVFLTEQEEEYVISCIKHCFPHHLVFQFECKNTLEDSILEQVTVAMSVVSSPDQSIHDLVPKFCIPVDKLVYNQPASIYAVYERTNDVTPAGINKLI